MLKLKLWTLASWCKELTHWKRPWCWERWKVAGEGNDGGWHDWMPSPTQWTWVWVNSGSLWWTGWLGVLQSMGSQRARQDWAIELNWTDEVLHWLLGIALSMKYVLKKFAPFFCAFLSSFIFCCKLLFIELKFVLYQFTMNKTKTKNQSK